MKNFIIRCPEWSAFLLLIIIVVSFIATYYCLHLTNQKSELNLTYYISALFASGLLILIAYLKTEQAIQQSRTNYLLRIDERWSSPEIIRARGVIHELYLEAKEWNPEIRDDNEQIKFIIGQSIMMLHDNKKLTEKFVALLNFLDFLETIGYMYSRRSITVQEIKELMGNSIIYFYEIFAAYIQYRRDTKDSDFYRLFESLYLDVRKLPVNTKQVSTG